MFCQFSLIHGLRFNASRGLLQAFLTNEAISVREGGKLREGKVGKTRLCLRGGLRYQLTPLAKGVRVGGGVATPKPKAYLPVEKFPPGCERGQLGPWAYYLTTSQKQMSGKANEYDIAYVVPVSSTGFSTGCGACLTRFGLASPARQSAPLAACLIVQVWSLADSFQEHDVLKAFALLFPGVRRLL